MQRPYKILITRSERDNQDFMQKCKLKNIFSFSFSGISYKSSMPSRGNLRYLHDSEYDNWIFVSPRAVNFFFQYKQAEMILQSAENIFAIGSSTAKKLSFFLPKQKIIYPNKASSESFLLLKKLQEVRGKVYYIVRAQSGRCLIHDALIKRGADVNYLESYKTILASKKESLKMIDIIDKEEIDCLIFTSFSIFKNIIKHLTKAQLRLLINMTITVVNKRMLDWAIEQGFANIIVLKEINNDAIIKAVIQHFREE